MLTPVEIIHLINKVKKAYPETQNIFLSDDDFMVNPQRAWEFFKKTKDLGVSFTVLGRVDKLSYPLLDAMKEGGVKTISLGIESFSDKVLESMGKNLEKDSIICTIHDIIDAGITPLINLIPYYPTTTLEDLKYTIHCATELMARGARVAYWDFAQAYEGSDIAYMDYEIEPDNFMINGKEFYRKGIVLPKDPEVRRIALKLRNRDKGNMTQPQEVLNFFKLNYEEMGEDTKRIEEVCELL